MKQLLAGYVECAWCGEPKKENVRWHSCPEAQRGLKSINDSVRGIWESVYGGIEYWGTKSEHRRDNHIRSAIALGNGRNDG